MIIRREALKAAAIVAGDGSDRGRYWSGHTFVHPDGVISATDGTIAVRITDGAVFKDEDFPTANLPELQPSTVDVAIPAGDLQRLIKGTAAKATIPILTTVRVGVQADGTINGVSTDLSAATIVRLGDIPKEPGIARICTPPDDRQYVTLIVAGDMLARLAKLATELHDNRKGMKSIRLEIPTVAGMVKDEDGGLKMPENGAVVYQGIHFSINGGTLSARGVFMPCRE